MGSAADELIALGRAYAAREAARADFDGPARPDPVGPGQTLLRRLDAERQEQQRPAELGRYPKGRVRYPGGVYDPRYG